MVYLSIIIGIDDDDAGDYDANHIAREMLSDHGPAYPFRIETSTWVYPVWTLDNKVKDNTNNVNREPS